MLSYDQAAALRDAISGVAGVAGFYRGRFGEIAWLFPGERIGGMRLLGDVLDIHLVADVSAKRNLFDVSADVEHLAHTAGVDHVLVTFDDARAGNNA